MKYTLETFQAAGHKHKSILNFGPPKTGKTRSLSTLIKMKMVPIHIFDFDNGCDPFIRQAVVAGAKQYDIVINRYMPTKGDKIGATEFRPRGQGREIFISFMEDINRLYDNMDPSKDDWKDGFIGPKVVVLDTATIYQEILLDFVLALRGHELNAKGTDARADYGAQMGKMVETVESLKGLPCISIINAHETLEKNELTGELRDDPAFTGKLAPVIGERFGVVIYSKTDSSGNFKWQTRPKGFIKTAGSRYKDGLDHEIDQDYSLIL